MKTSFLLGLALLAVGCAEGSGAESYRLGSGLYDLVTTDIGGECALEGAVTPGEEYVGKASRVRLSVRDLHVTLEACDAFFPNDCFPAFETEAVGMVREDEHLFASSPHWPVPGCHCFDELEGSRSVEGTVDEEDTAQLEWSFELPTAPVDCFCNVTACSGSLVQRLDRVD